MYLTNKRGLKPRAILTRSLTATVLALGVFLSGMTGAFAQEVQLKFATTMPEGHPFFNIFKPWLATINEAGEGEFKVVPVFGQTFATTSNVWDRTVDGITDIGWSLHGNVGLPFKKSLVTSLPLLVEDVPAASVALWQLYEQKLIDDEYKNVRVMGLWVNPVSGLHTKDPIETLADLKGQKIRVVDGATAGIVSALGAAPLSIPSTEVYQSLSSGVVEGLISNWNLVGPFKLFEVAPYHQETVALGAPPGFMIINLNSYDRLSDKGKKIFDEFTGAYLSRAMGQAVDGLRRYMHGLGKKAPNQVFNSMADDEKAHWEELLASVIVDWEADTPNGPAILQAFKDAYGEAKAQGGN